MRRSAPLETLRGRIDLDRVPFTDRGSRFLVWRRGEDALTVGLAAFATDSRAAAPIKAIRFCSSGGDCLPIETSARPDRIDVNVAGRGYVVAQDGPYRLVIGVPAGSSWLEIEVAPMRVVTGDRRRLHIASSDRRDDLLLECDAAHCTTSIEAGRDGITRVRLDLVADTDSIVALTDVNADAEGDAIRSPQGLRLEAILSRAERRWAAWFASVPPVSPTLRSTYLHSWWVLWAGLIDDTHGREMLVPSKTRYVGLWAWDSLFHAIGLAHADPGLARGQIRLLLDHQLADGQLPDVVHLDGGVTAHSSHDPGTWALVLPLDERTGRSRTGRDPNVPLTKPPLAPWAVWRVHQIAPDLDFLRETYDALGRSLMWWSEASDPDSDGLAAYLHPFSSGLDDCPLFDLGSPVGSPDLPAYLAASFDALADIASAIGKEADSAVWRTKAARLVTRLIKLRWLPGEDRFTSTRPGVGSVPRTALDLMPLFTGRLPRRISARLVDDLTDPSRFWAQFPVPTVALDEPTFDPRTMCRGPAWINVNFMLIEGLRRSGYGLLAKELRSRTLSLIAGTDDAREYYDPLTGQPPAEAASAFGWTAALLIDLAVEAHRDASG